MQKTLDALGLPQELVSLLRSMEGKRVAVAMSGGVDSSTTAALLKLAGADVTGIHMLTLPEDDPAFNKAALDDAESVAAKLSIPFETVDVKSLFREKVVQYFIDSYISGLTPNPCVQCNISIKFGMLLAHALKSSDFYATGHYARSFFNGKRHVLMKPVDKLKDQTYVLSMLSQDMLSKAVFPLGHIPKKQTREIASMLGLHVKDKAESQDLCFVKGTRRDYIGARMGGKCLGGDVVDSSDRLLARHEGVHCFAIGQRRGLGISGSEPHFVKAIDAKSGKVTVAGFNGLLRDSFSVGNINWSSVEPLKAGETMDCQVVIRNKMEPQDAVIIQNNSFAEVKMRGRPIWAVAPGQVAAFYSGDVVLGGGFILG
jgi:tRNA-specific 2-thiouridylase